MTTTNRAPRGLSPRKRGPDKVKLHLYVPPTVARDLRVRAATEGRTISELTSEALAAHLDEGEEHGPKAA